MNEYRTHYCNELRIADVGKEVRIAGWVQTIRDLGSVIFLDIRDHFGITQAVISDDEEEWKELDWVVNESNTKACIYLSPCFGKVTNCN